MKKRKREKYNFQAGGFSVIEIFSITVIAVIIIGIVISLLSYYKKKAAQGTDSLNLVTAKNLAAVNVNETGNIFKDENEMLVGYYDDVTNSIVTSKPKGYNKSTVMTVNGVMYTGSPDTMVIRITYDGSEVKFDWVEDH